jgi:micrococcal nuclease
MDTNPVIPGIVNRKVCRPDGWSVYVGDLDVNAELVRRGAAWVYRKYAKDPSLFALEAEARRAERGLWGLAEAERVPPWEWRRR